jgi:hypothetical protein
MKSGTLRLMERELAETAKRSFLITHCNSLDRAPAPTPTAH